MRILILASFAIAISAQAEIENELIRHFPDHTHTASVFSVGTAWDSAYYLEGRNSLDGDSIASVNLETNYQNFIAGLWYGNSPESTYDETNLYLEYGFTLAEFEFFVGYTGLVFLSDDTFDHDLSAGFSTPELTGEFVASVQVLRTLRGDGFYYSGSLSREFTPLEHFSLTPSVTFNFNNDYIGEGSEGLDHILFRLDASYEIDHTWTLEAFAAFSMSIKSNLIDNPDDELLEDFFFAGTSLSYSL